MNLKPDLAIEAIRAKVAEPARPGYRRRRRKGILRVVSSSIAEGIRLASVSRGLDPREFALMGFGGAAGLVATRVAREIGIDHVLIPPAGPVLSAFGMMASDLKYDLAVSHPSSLSTVDLDGLRSAFATLIRGRTGKNPIGRRCGVRDQRPTIRGYALSRSDIRSDRGRARPQPAG